MLVKIVQIELFFTGLYVAFSQKLLKKFILQSTVCGEGGMVAMYLCAEKRTKYCLVIVMERVLRKEVIIIVVKVIALQFAFPPIHTQECSVFNIAAISLPHQLD